MYKDRKCRKFIRLLIKNKNSLLNEVDRIVPEYTEVDEHTTLDLQASYDLPGNSRITVGALNVTDEDPPWSNSYEGYAVATAGHSPLGTVLYGRVTIRF